MSRAGHDAASPVPAPRWLVEVPLAHQGLHGPGVARNSLAAFEAAALAGVGIELDVRITGDGVAVVSHDRGVATSDGRTVRIDRCSMAELATLRLAEGGEPLPTLAEAFAVVAGRVPVMVEVKNETGSVGAVESATAQVLDGRGDPLVVASFNPMTLRWFRRHAPEFVRVQTAGADGVPSMARRVLARMIRADLGAPAALSWHLGRLGQPAPVAARAAGMPVVAWTIRTVDDLAVARAGADNVIFEDLSVAEVTGSG